MSKLAQTVDYPFTKDQSALPGVHRRTIPNRTDLIQFYKSHQRMSWDLNEILDLDPREIKIEALTSGDAYVAESAMLVESNNPEYLANLLAYFKEDQDFCDFIVIWAAEEWKHYYALRDYLTKVEVRLADGVPEGAESSAHEYSVIEESVHQGLTAKVADVRAKSVTNWSLPMHYVPAQMLAALSLQEFVTAEFYRSHARHTGEPMLEKIELLISRDETRHEMYYEKKARDLIEKDAKLLPLVTDALKEFGMPGAFILDGYDERREAMEQAAFPTMAKKKAAFVRLFAKVLRLVGRENALAIFTEGNYFTDGLDEPGRRKLRPELIARLLVQRLGA